MSSVALPVPPSGGAGPPAGGEPRPPLPADRARVLIVDDNRANLAAFEVVLADPGFDVVTAGSGEEAMRLLLQRDFAVILLDINMPSLDGLETATLVRQRERTRDVPILFVTAYAPYQQQILRGYASGAVDYLVKPVSPEILRSKVRVFVELWRKTRQIEWQASQLRAVNARLHEEMRSRQEAERDAAFERDERQRVALASIADAVVAVDGAANVVSLNPAAEKLIGCRSDEVRGAPVEALLGAGAAAEGLSRLLRAAMTRDGLAQSHAEIAFTAAASGELHYLDCSAMPVHDRRGDTVGAVLVAQDVTARRQGEIERARMLRGEKAARQAAEEASRARDQFLAVISHELRTPLNAILGWTQILRTARADQVPVEQAVAAIYRNALAQQKLIEDLLDMSRIINGKVEMSLQDTAFEAVTANAVETLRPVAGDKGITLTYAVEGAPPRVNADPIRLEQVVWNVLSNAVKFTPEGGKVAVRVFHADGEVCCEIRDSGAGIAPAFLAEIFEAFRQADSSTARRQGGLGLGLAIARELVHRHGGAIDAASEGEGRGATFTIRLPRSDGPVRAPASQSACGTASPAPADASLANLRLLAVDDDAETLEMLAIVAREHGAAFRGARNAAEGMALLHEWAPDVLLSDISMPGEDGYAFIRQVRSLDAAEGGSVPAIAITAMASEQDREAALAAGFQAHVAKPLAFPTLVAVIARTSARAAPPAPAD